MQSILEIAKHNLKMFFNSKLGIIFLLAPVLLSTVLLGKFMMGQELMTAGTVGVVSREANNRTEMLKRSLEEKAFEVNSIEEHEVEELIQKGKIDVGILMEQDVAKVIYNEENSIGKQVEDIVANKMMTQKMLEQLSGNNEEQLQIIQTKYEAAMPLVKKQDTQKELVAPMVFGMFIFVFLMVVGVSLSPIMRDREGKVFERIQIAPIKKYQYILGHLLGSLSILSTQILLQGIAFKVLKIDTGIQIGSFVLIGIVLAVVGISISMVILAFTKKLSFYYMVIGLGITPLTMISDCLFPIELMPKWIQTVSYISPVRWIMIAYKEMQKGENLNQMIYSLGIALVIAIILILINIVREQYRGIEN